MFTTVSGLFPFPQFLFGVQTFSSKLACPETVISQNDMRTVIWMSFVRRIIVEKNVMRFERRRLYWKYKMKFDRNNIFIFRPRNPSGTLCVYMPWYVNPLGVGVLKKIFTWLWPRYPYPFRPSPLPDTITNRRRSYSMQSSLPPRFQSYPTWPNP